jgi:hypothetical protein
MSSKSLKNATANNRVVALPSRKRKNEDGSETQLYNIYMMK